MWLLSTPLFQAGLKILAVLAMILGVFWFGTLYGKQVLQTEIAEERAEWISNVAAKQQELQQQQTRILTAVQNKTSVIKETVRVIQGNPQIIEKYLPASVNCPLPVGFIELHNKAATSVPITDLMQVNDSTAQLTDKTLSDATRVITLNYYEYEQIRQQLIGLQATVRAFQEKQQQLTK